MAKYPFDTIEPKWQKYWDEHKTFRATETDIPKDKRRYVSSTTMPDNDTCSR